MKRVLLTTMGIAALGMVSYAATFMRVKTADGSIVRYAVEDVIEVDFEDEYVIPSDTVPVSNHPYVDLGLPSGTLWATYNVGATKPEEYGDYFAWGETEPKEVYNWKTYKWGIASDSSDPFDFDSLTKYNSEDGMTTLLPEDDAATANWGKEWRMPTNEEQRELQKNSYMVWTNGYNGTDVRGVIFYKAKSTDDKGKFVRSWQTPSSDYSVSSDAHVFLPAADRQWGNVIVSNGNYGCYWSPSLEKDSEYYVHYFEFEDNRIGFTDFARIGGCPVRAVLAKKAERKMYSVKFYTSDSILIESQEVLEGASAKEIQAPEKNGYEFVGWSSSFDKVTSDLSVYALYKQIVPKMYIVKFYTSDSILIESQEVVEGASAKEIQAPEKNGYDFIGWSASLDIITSDMSVYALYADHSYVDLGLPSGTLWATYNIGATKPEEYGDYFAWGETEPKEVYDWGTYKYATSSDDDLDSITKYNMSGNYGIIDSLSVLLPEDDAATANWGSEWRMPTNEEQRELQKNSYMVWTDGYNGTDVKGVIFYKAKSADDKGKFVRAGKTPSSNYSVSSDAHVFLPVAGYRSNDEFYFVGYDGYYWSSSLRMYREDTASILGLYEEEVYWYDILLRFIGQPVRAVRVK